MASLSKKKLRKNLRNTRHDFARLLYVMRKVRKALEVPEGADIIEWTRVMRGQVSASTNLK